MLALKIAWRYLLRRKVRMAMIGVLVALGTMVIILGESISLSAKVASRESIINYFTGDMILYSARSKEKPSPFAFTTPHPVIVNVPKIKQWLDKNPLVDRHVAITQNYGLLSIEKKGKKSDLPFFFYAVNPASYRATFPNISMVKGAFFTTDSGGPATGVVISKNQAENYSKNYSIDLAPGDKVTLLSLTDGGAVNAAASRVIGIYDPIHYKNIFNYIIIIAVMSVNAVYTIN